MVSEPATTTRSPSLITISNGISSFSAPSSSDFGDAQHLTEGWKGAETYKIIEKVLSFGSFFLPCNRPFETSFSHVVQVICTTGNQHNEPGKPRQVSDEGENPVRMVQKRAIRSEKDSNTSFPTQSGPSVLLSLRLEAFQSHHQTPYHSLHRAFVDAGSTSTQVQTRVKPHAKYANKRARSTDCRTESVSVS